MRIENNKKVDLLQNDRILKAQIKEEEVKKTEVKDIYEFNVTGKELTMFFEMAKETMIVREDKIAEIKEKIETGQYNVTGHDVVMKLLGEK